MIQFMQQFQIENYFEKYIYIENDFRKTNLQINLLNKHV